jgi:hypothetical protein
MLHLCEEKHEICEKVIDLDQGRATGIPGDARHLCGAACGSR